jgi:hypothetical protein
MIDVENGEHQSSNTFLAHLYLSSNIPVKRLNTNLQTTSLGTLSCVQELVSTTMQIAAHRSLVAASAANQDNIA